MSFFPADTDEAAVIVRADFTDEQAWARFVDQMCTPLDSGEEISSVFIEDRSLSGVDAPRLLEIVAEELNFSEVYIVDHSTLSSPEFPLLAINLCEGVGIYGRSFRIAASQMYSFWANMSLANMDFEEFADRVDDDGVFRGF